MRGGAKEGDVDPVGAVRDGELSAGFVTGGGVARDGFDVDRSAVTSGIVFSGLLCVGVGVVEEDVPEVVVTGMLGGGVTIPPFPPPGPADVVVNGAGVSGPGVKRDVLPPLLSYSKDRRMPTTWKSRNRLRCPTGPWYRAVH